MPRPSIFGAAFGDELLKIAVQYPKKGAAKPRELTVTEGNALGSPYQKPRPQGIPASVQKARWAKPPGMMSTGNPPPQKPAPKKPGARMLRSGGGAWNTGDPSQEIATKVRAAKARNQSIRGTDIEEETTVSGS